MDNERGILINTVERMLEHNPWPTQHIYNFHSKFWAIQRLDCAMLLAIVTVK
jgi:hypothetical protein